MGSGMRQTASSGPSIGAHTSRAPEPRRSPLGRGACGAEKCRVWVNAAEVSCSVAGCPGSRRRARAGRGPGWAGQSSNTRPASVGAHSLGWPSTLPGIPNTTAVVMLRSTMRPSSIQSVSAYGQTVNASPSTAERVTMPLCSHACRTRSAPVWNQEVRRHPSATPRTKESHAMTAAGRVFRNARPNSTRVEKTPTSRAWSATIRLLIFLLSRRKSLRRLGKRIEDLYRHSSESLLEINLSANSSLPSEIAKSGYGL